MNQSIGTRLHNLKQANETAKSTLAQGCTTDRGIAAQDAQRAVQEADEYLAAGDMLEAYGLFCFASGKLYDNHTHWKERFRWLYLEGSKISGIETEGCSVSGVARRHRRCGGRRKRTGGADVEVSEASSGGRDGRRFAESTFRPLLISLRSTVHTAARSPSSSGLTFVPVG
jgi:hypothetical protein